MNRIPRQQWLGLGFLSLLFLPTLGLSQQIGVGVPFSGYNESGFERMGVQFGFSFPGGQGPGSRVVGLLPGGQLTSNGNLFFSQGGFGSAIPAFGGYDPNASGRFGFGRVSPGGGGFNLGFEMGKGNSRTMTHSSSSLMVQNGFGGSISSGQLSPFVTGWIPVSGNGGGLDNGVTRAAGSGLLNLSGLGQQTETALPASAAPDPPPVKSSAESGTASVRAIKARKLAADQGREQAVADHLQAVEVHLANGQTELARLELNRAIALETDTSRKQSLKNRLKKLK